MHRMLFYGLVLSFFIIPTPLFSQNLNAANELKLGIAAYEKAKYEEAIEHLERALALDPESRDGHLYLARTYDGMYVESPECGEEACAANNHLRVRAMQEFDKVLEFAPSNTEALKALAWRYSQRHEFDEADHYYRKALEVDPNDVESLYALAVMQWMQSYRTRQEKRAELKIRRSKPFITSPTCIEVRIENLARVEDGMTLLKRALDLVKSYDAETYLSLLYQERADIQCGDRSAYEQDAKSAAEWAHRACKTRRDPKRASIPCTSMVCPSVPPPPEPGQPGACPE
jgi:tetratricopeptide (TPR) repeat protein